MQNKTDEKIFKKKNAQQAHIAVINTFRFLCISFTRKCASSDNLRMFMRHFSYLQSKPIFDNRIHVFDKQWLSIVSKHSYMEYT